MECAYCHKLISKPHVARHKGQCSVRNDEITRLKEEVARLQAENIELKSNGEIARLTAENNELKNKLIEEYGDKTKRARTMTMNVTNNNVNIENLNIVAYGDEPRLIEAEVRQMLRDVMSLSDVVPTFLKNKHFDSEATTNIRLNTVSDKIETVRRDSKGKLVWKKESKPVQKFCQDLALNTVEELNTKYCAENHPGWRAYCRNRFGDHPDPDLKKQNPEKILAKDVEDMIAKHSQMEE
jgi:hypothetical protein